MPQFNQYSTGGFAAAPTSPSPISDVSAPAQILEHAAEVLRLEAESVASLIPRLGATFVQAVDMLHQCAGKVVVTGMGKSGHIATKLAATFASTGTPAFFVHPAELRHGDFGMLEERDLVIALSGSGETPEIKVALDPIKRRGIKIIALTGNLTSTLAQFSDVVIDVGVTREACPLNLAPTCSTTAALAMGDALAIVLMTKKQYGAEDFARNHPGGSLGQKLVTVSGVMRLGGAVPTVPLHAKHEEILVEITEKRLGFTSVCDAAGKLAGIITDGDLRRAMKAFGPDVFSKVAEQIMTPNPKTIKSSALAVEALNVMEKFAISDLLIVDEQAKPVGLIDLKDLLRAGII